MPRPPATQTQIDAVRSKIRQAAIELYREQGLSHLTARAIAVRAGVAVGTIYKHFGSLSELARTLWQGPVDRFEASLPSIIDEHQEPEQRLRVLLKAYVDFAERNAELYRGAFLYVRPPNSEQPEREPLTSSAFAKHLIETLQQGQSAGVFQPGDPNLQAQLLWAGLHGAIALPTNLDRLQWQPTELRREMVDTLLRLVASD